ncbi:MAG: hypothetical protein AABZ39_00215 [Spirochaetota bacterium]
MNDRPRWIIDNELAVFSRPGYGLNDATPDIVDEWLDVCKAEGIRSIICLLTEDDIAEHFTVDLPYAWMIRQYGERGFHVDWIPIVDGREVPITEDEGVRIRSAFDKLPKPVLIHSKSGMFRSAAAAEFITTSDIDGKYTIVFPAQENSLAMQVTGNQYPNNADADYDLPWLNITVNARHNGRSWELTSPTIRNTKELSHFRDYLITLSRDAEPVHPDFFFTEPTMFFSAIASDADTVRLSIQLSYEHLPEDMRDDTVVFSVRIERKRLLAYANVVDAWLRQFPERKEW